MRTQGSGLDGPDYIPSKNRFVSQRGRVSNLGDLYKTTDIRPRVPDYSIKKSTSEKIISNIRSMNLSKAFMVIPKKMVRCFFPKKIEMSTLAENKQVLKQQKHTFRENVYQFMKLESLGLYINELPKDQKEKLSEELKIKKEKCFSIRMRGNTELNKKSISVLKLRKEEILDRLSTLHDLSSAIHKKINTKIILTPEDKKNLKYLKKEFRTLSLAYEILKLDKKEIYNKQTNNMQIKLSMTKQKIQKLIKRKLQNITKSEEKKLSDSFNKVIRNIDLLIKAEPAHSVTHLSAEKLGEQIRGMQPGKEKETAAHLGNIMKNFKDPVEESVEKLEQFVELLVKFKCNNCDDAKAREKIMQSFLKLATHCHTLKNDSMAFFITKGIQDSIQQSQIDESSKNIKVLEKISKECQKLQAKMSIKTFSDNKDNTELREILINSIQDQPNSLEKYQYNYHDKEFNLHTQTKTDAIRTQISVEGEAVERNIDEEEGYKQILEQVFNGLERHGYDYQPEAQAKIIEILMSQTYMNPLFAEIKKEYGESIAKNKDYTIQFSLSQNTNDIIFTKKASFNRMNAENPEILESKIYVTFKIHIPKSKFIENQFPMHSTDDIGMSYVFKEIPRGT